MDVRLRDLSNPLRVAATCLILLLAGGYAASLSFMVHHVSQKDGRPGLSLTDVKATYHGVQTQAAILTALDDPRHEESYLKDVPAEEIRILREWLEPEGGPQSALAIQAAYDTLPMGVPEETLAPADVLFARCVRCHAAGATEGGDAAAAIHLGRWPDVEKYVYSKDLRPVSAEILAQSTHTHAPAISLIALVAAGLLLASGWPRWFRHGVVMLLFAALLVDLSGMWLARPMGGLCWMVIIGGALFGAALGLALGAALLHMWLGRPRSRARAGP